MALAVSGRYAFLSTDNYGPLVIDISDPADPRRVDGGTDERGAYANAMAVVGDYVYIASNDGLQVFNISDPANPRWVWGDTTTGIGSALAVSGTRLILAGSAGLYILDLTTPERPQRLGNFPTAYSRVLALTVEGAYASVVTSEWGGTDVALEIIDPMSPAKPQLVATIKSPMPSAVAIAGQRLFLWGGTLLMYDLSDPAHPRQVSTYDNGRPAYPTAVAVDGNSCYLVSGLHGPFGGYTGAFFDILDVSDSTNPRRQGSFHDAAGWMVDVALAGSYAYVAERVAGLLVFDISDPARPALVGRADTGSNASAVAVAGSLACLAVEGGLRVVDVSNPAQPVIVGRYDTEGQVMDVAAAGNHAYLLDPRAGLLVIELSDPAHPRRAGSYPAALGSALAVAGSHAYLNGLQIIDVSDPANPARVGEFGGASGATSVAISGDYALLGDSSGLLVIDISSPARPVQVGSRSLYSGYGIFVAGSGNLAGVSMGDAFDLFDLTDPTQPYRIGHLTDPSLFGSTAVALSGNHACVTTSTAYPGGLWVIDVAARSNPQRVGVEARILSAQDIEISGNHAYVACGFEGLQIVDIANPAKPELVGVYDTPDVAWAVAKTGDYVFVADDNTGLVIIDVSSLTTSRRVGGIYIAGAQAWDVAVAGEFAYVVGVPDGGGAGLWVFNVSDPRQPRRVGRYQSNLRWAKVSLSGSRAYLGSALPEHVEGAGSGALEMLDLSDPIKPRRSGSYPVVFPNFGIPTFNTLTYLEGGDEVWMLRDDSDPANPRLVGGYRTIAAAFGVLVSGRYAYVPRRASGLQVFELTDRANPRLVGWNSAVARATSVAIAGGNIFVTAESDHGLFSLAMLPFFRSISRTGSELHLSWEGWGKARIEGTPSLSNSNWRDLLIPETTNDAILPSDSGNQFFRLIRP